jgi:hypothetical protein
VTAEDPRPLELERLRHVAGQMLRHRDFRAQVRADADLLDWHQRAVHAASGIVKGLAATVTADGSVEVAAGLAYDCFGRALLVPEPRTIEPPPAGTASTLVLATGGLVWMPSECVRPRHGVAIAFHDGAGLRLALRLPTTRVLAQPRIAAGVTPAGGTAWEPWLLPGIRFARVIGIQVRVDTRAAGFTDVPCYFAWLQWPGVASAHRPAEDYSAFGRQSVQLEAAEGFTFRVALLRDEQGELDVVLAHGERMHVAWLGIQAEGRS